VKGITPAITKDGHKIDILVNCAGIQRRHPSAEFPDNDWNEVRNNLLQSSECMLTVKIGDTSKSYLSFHSLP
jgi:short-subunit dehydrogenase